MIGSGVGSRGNTPSMSRVPASHKISDFGIIRNQLSFITARQMGLVTGCTTKDIKTAVRQNQISVVRLGNWDMIPATEIDRYKAYLTRNAYEVRARLIAETEMAVRSAMARL
jgi:hypothetical protein